MEFINVYTIVVFLLLMIAMVLWVTTKSEAQTPSPIRLRRWRDSIKEGPGARQVRDDWWDRANNSGQGFQLG
jgi:hypothetical protein